MSSTTDIQQYADSAGKGSYRPTAGNAGVATQNSGSWMLDLVSQHYKSKPAVTGKQVQQDVDQINVGVQPAAEMPSGMSKSVQAAANPVQGAPLHPSQVKKKRGRPVGSRNKGPSKKRQDTRENVLTQPFIQQTAALQPQQPASDGGALAAAAAAAAIVPQETTTAANDPQEAEQDPTAKPPANLQANASSADGVQEAAEQVQPVKEHPASGEGEPVGQSSHIVHPHTAIERDAKPAQGKHAEETLGTKRRPRPPKPKLDL